MGYREAELRRHSLEWLRALVARTNAEAQARGEATGELVKQLQKSSGAILAVAVHYAVAAVFNEEAGGKLEEFIERLNSDEDEDDWLLDPEAKGYDLGVLAAAGLPVPPATPPTQEEAS